MPLMREQHFDPDATVAVFENPLNGYQEAVPKLAWLWMLLFGIFYMAYRGLWLHFGIALGIAVIASILFGPLLILVAPIVSITYATIARKLLITNYLQKGWHEVELAL